MGGKGSGGTPGNKSAKRVQDAQSPKAPDAETNTAILAYNKELFLLPAMTSYTAQAIAERIAEYVDISNRHGMKLQVNGAALALGMTRQDLYAITHDKQTTYHGCPIDQDALAILRKFYALLASALETAIQDGRQNPVGLIFLAKNHFGYQSEIVHTTTTPQAAPQLTAADDIANRYTMTAGRQPAQLEDAPTATD